MTSMCFQNEVCLKRTTISE